MYSVHVTNVSNGDAELTAGFDIYSRQVSAVVSAGNSGINTCIVSSASSIAIGMAVTGTNIDYNTFVTDISGTTITLNKNLTGTVSGIGYFTPNSRVTSRLPIPVGAAVEIMNQPFILSANDSIRIQSTGVGSFGSISTTGSGLAGFSTVLMGGTLNGTPSAGNLVAGTGIATNTYVSVGYTGGNTVVLTRALTSTMGTGTTITFTDTVVPEDGALNTTITYQSFTDSTYQNGTGTVVGIVTTTPTTPGVTSTTPTVYYGAGVTYPAIIQSIRVANISDNSTIYPGGDYNIWVGIGNSDTIFSYLAYNMTVPKNSLIELCTSPKRIGIGQSIFAYSDTPGVLEIQIAGRQSPS